MQKSLTEIHVAITGGARGIGQEIAADLAKGGARVTIGDVDPDAVDATASTLSGSVYGLHLDVTNAESFTTFLFDAETRFGPVDVLINNAGVMWVGPFDKEPEISTDRMIDINLRAVIRGVQLAAPAMRRRGRGHIITIASAAARLSPPGESSYAATKHGVLGYLTGVREELRGTGVDLSVIMPGVVETELAAGTASGAAKVLQPADVARVVAQTIKRPRFEVTIPGYIGPLVRFIGILPQWARDLILRKMVPDQVAATRNSNDRANYETRAGIRSKMTED